MKVALIVAVDRANGIGKNNDLMWHLPADMKFFKETTAGQIVITGRKNYESIPERFRPLPNRENVVLTRDQALHFEGCKQFNSLEASLEHFKNETERTVFIIGGGEIYKQALALNCIDEMYISHVDHEFGADTFFPSIDQEQWDKKILFQHPMDEKHLYAFETIHYTKKKNTTK